MPWWVLDCPEDTAAIWKYASQTTGGDCPITYSQQISWIVGMLSICIWMVALSPQIYQNYISKAVGNVSIWGWVVWLLGDIFNLMAALLTVPIVPSEVGNAIVYLIATGVVLGQCIYYSYVAKSPQQMALSTLTVSNVKAHTCSMQKLEKELKARRSTWSGVSSTNNSTSELTNGPAASASTEIGRTDDVPVKESQSFQKGTKPYLSPTSPEGKKRRHASSLDTGLDMLKSGEAESLPLSVDKRYVSYNSFSNSQILKAINVITIISLITSSSGSKGGIFHHRHHQGHYIHRHYIGDADGEKQPWFVVFIAWAMTTCYTLFRIPQIQLMWYDRSEGLSMAMFMLTFTGNLTFLISVMLRNDSVAYLSDQLPWIVDAVLCMSLDVIILILFHRQNRNDRLLKEKMAEVEEAQFA